MIDSTHKTAIRLSVAICMILTVNSVLYAQQVQVFDDTDTKPYPSTVGYSNKSSLDEVLDYRLPKWNYAFFNLNLDNSFERDSQKHFISYKKYPDASLMRLYDYDKNRHFNLDINLDYSNVFYSENRITKLNLNLGFNRDRQQIRDIYDLTTREVYSYPRNRQDKSSDDKVFDFDTDIDLQNDTYIQPNFFITTNAGFNYSIGKDKFTQTLEMQLENDDAENDWRIKNNYTNKYISANPAVGLGFGRIRNVTPIYRAMRFNERLSKLGFQSLNKSELRELGAVMTSLEGYQMLFKRPEKYFYNDLFRTAGLMYSDFTPYDMMYLNEVYDEALATRYEGFRISYLLDYEYEYSEQNGSEVDFNIYPPESVYSTTKQVEWQQTAHNTYFTEVSRLSHAVHLDYYTNFSLKWMFGLNAKVGYTFVDVREVDKETTKRASSDRDLFARNTSRNDDDYIDYSLKMSLLYDMTDRFKLNVATTFKRDDHIIAEPFNVNLNAHYFWENNVVISPYAKWSVLNTSYNNDYSVVKGMHTSFGITAKIFLGRSLNF